MLNRLVRMNDWFLGACDGAGHTLEVLSRAAMAARRAMDKTEAIVVQRYKASLGSLTIVALTSLFTGMILALHSGIELQRFNQESSIGYLVPAAMCREMGPVMTAIALAGLIGSTCAAEIGTMKVSEELDALEVMSIDPVYFLVMPRLIGLSTAAVALTICAFGVTIAAIACSQGMRAGHGAEGVGMATMKTVVFSFVYILMFDYLIGWALY